MMIEELCILRLYMITLYLVCMSSTSLFSFWFWSSSWKKKNIKIKKLCLRVKGKFCWIVLFRERGKEVLEIVPNPLDNLYINKICSEKLFIKSVYPCSLLSHQICKGKLSLHSIPLCLYLRVRCLEFRQSFLTLLP